MRSAWLLLGYGLTASFAGPDAAPTTRTTASHVHEPTAMAALSSLVGSIAHGPGEHRIDRTFRRPSGRGRRAGPVDGLADAPGELPRPAVAWTHGAGTEPRDDLAPAARGRRRAHRNAARRRGGAGGRRGARGSGRRRRADRRGDPSRPRGGRGGRRRSGEAGRPGRRLPVITPPRFVDTWAA